MLRRQRTEGSDSNRARVNTSQDPILKILNNKKEDFTLTQMVECLCSNCEAQNANSVSPKKKKDKKKEKMWQISVNIKNFPEFQLSCIIIFSLRKGV
jgi:hypothetical protein